MRRMHVTHNGRLTAPAIHFEIETQSCFRYTQLCGDDLLLAFVVSLGEAHYAILMIPGSTVPIRLFPPRSTARFSDQ